MPPSVVIPEAILMLLLLLLLLPGVPLQHLYASNTPQPAARHRRPAAASAAAAVLPAGLLDTFINTISSSLSWLIGAGLDQLPGAVAADGESVRALKVGLSVIVIVNACITLLTLHLLSALIVESIVKAYMFLTV